MKRVFIGVPIEKNLQRTIKKWTDLNLKKIQVRIIKAGNLHITLLPPWYEKEENIKNLGIRNTKTGKMKIKFEKVRFGPDEKNPRLVWAEGKVDKSFLKLKGNLQKEFNKKPEQREFLLHLTLARFKSKDFKKFGIKKLNSKVNWKKDVKEIALFESKLSPKGADYIILKRFDI